MSLEMKIDLPTYNFDKIVFDTCQDDKVTYLKVSLSGVLRMYSLPTENFTVSNVLQSIASDINSLHITLSDDLGNTTFSTNLLLSQLAYHIINKNKQTFEAFFDKELNKEDYTQKIQKVKKFAYNTFGKNATVTYNDTSVTFNSDDSLGYIAKINFKDKTIETNTPGFKELPNDKKNAINTFLLSLL